jgi:hypothetical protein
MATNDLYPAWDGRMSVVVTNPATPVSGEPVRYGALTGVAETDEGGGGNIATETTVNFGFGIWDLYVFDEATTGVAVGDSIFYDDTAGGAPSTHLTNLATGMEGYFGVALEVVGANATTLIKVLHVPFGASVAMAAGSVSAGMLAAGAVDTETILGTALKGSADGLGNLRCARFTFDPSATAGMRTVAAHGLGVTLPDNAVVLGGGVEILTTFHSPSTGAGVDKATIALHIQGANDLITATAIESGTFWDAVAWKVVVPDAMAAAGVATAIKLTAAREVTATVGVDPLDAGKLIGWLYYVIGG